MSCSSSFCLSDSGPENFQVGIPALTNLSLQNPRITWMSSASDLLIANFGVLFSPAPQQGQYFKELRLSLSSDRTESAFCAGISSIRCCLGARPKLGTYNSRLCWGCFCISALWFLVPTISPQKLRGASMLISLLELCTFTSFRVSVCALFKQSDCC